jgi:hypothetical protein
MDKAVRSALKSQYRACLDTIRDAVVQCPEDLWTKETKMPPFWQIAYHAVFFTHFYMIQGESDLRPWPKHRREACSLQPGIEPAYTREEVLEAIDFVVALIEPTIDSLDLETSDCGFPWYKLPKMDHEMLNLRHTMEHAGQLDALLRLNGQEGVDWHA